MEENPGHYSPQKVLAGNPLYGALGSAWTADMRTRTPGQPWEAGWSEQDRVDGRNAASRQAGLFQGTRFVDGKDTTEFGGEKTR